MKAAQVVVEIVREKMFSRQSALSMKVPTITQKNVSKVSERKKKNLVRLMIRTIDVQNVRVISFLDMDMNTTELQNF